MHDSNPTLTELCFDLARDALAGPRPLSEPPALSTLGAMLSPSITDVGLGAHEAVRLLRDVVAAHCMSVSSPNVWAFVPSAATPASLLGDVVVSAMNVIADWWLEGAGAIAAEEAALRWLCNEIGLPSGSGGVFVSGATLGNVSALAAARSWWRGRNGSTRRSAIVCGQQAHSSLRLAAQVLDCDLINVEGNRYGRIDAESVSAAIDANGRARSTDIVAVAATGGTTNLGMVDDLDGLATLCAERGLWLHVDAAYGGAGRLSHLARRVLNGLERADSLVIDPHKWLFTGYDCCALLYRCDDDARRAFTQTAEYLDAAEAGLDERNPSDYAIHLTRRARGVPFWFGLAVHGADAYRAAVTECLETALAFTAHVRSSPHLTLFAPTQLSVVTFQRVGWSREEYDNWAAAHLRAGDWFVAPTEFRGQPTLRVCIVNPRTTLDQLVAMTESLR